MLSEFVAKRCRKEDAPSSEVLASAQDVKGVWASEVAVEADDRRRPPRGRGVDHAAPEDSSSQYQCDEFFCERRCERCDAVCRVQVRLLSPPGWRARVVERIFSDSNAYTDPYDRRSHPRTSKSLHH